jgi:hypothetical protein
VEEETVYLMEDRKQREREERLRDQIQPSKACPPNELLLPARPHLLTFLPPPKIAPAAGDQALNT